MMYQLKDGREIDLTKVEELTQVRDEGNDKSYISLSKIAFTIRMKNGRTIKVERSYHYSDWGASKKDLEQERNAIISAINALGKD